MDFDVKHLKLLKFIFFFDNRFMYLNVQADMLRFFRFGMAKLGNATL
jgi:hypothetical protein